MPPESKPATTPSEVKDEKPDIKDEKAGAHGTQTGPQSPTTTKRKREREAKAPRQQWTEAEDAVFKDLVANAARPHIWAAVQADGRLAHKTNGSVHSHLNLLYPSSLIMPAERKPLATAAERKPSVPAVKRKPRANSTAAASSTSSNKDTKPDVKPKPERKERKKPEFWTADEDRWLREIVDGIARPQIWQATQADGRLAHKSNGAIHARLTTLVRGCRTSLTPQLKDRVAKQ